MTMVLLQTINFFNLGPKHCLVDLPGYGFAYAKEEVKDAWEELVSCKQNFTSSFPAVFESSLEVNS